jgi:hypothetical protein
VGDQSAPTLPPGSAIGGVSGASGFFACSGTLLVTTASSKAVGFTDFEDIVTRQQKQKEETTTRLLPRRVLPRTAEFLEDRDPSGALLAAYKN